MNVLAGEVVALLPSGKPDVDVDEFERLADRSAVGDDPPTVAQALAVCRGELLPLDPCEGWPSVIASDSDCVIGSCFVGPGDSTTRLRWSPPTRRRTLR